MNNNTGVHNTLESATTGSFDVDIVSLCFRCDGSGGKLTTITKGGSDSDGGDDGMCRSWCRWRW